MAFLPKTYEKKRVIPSSGALLEAPARRFIGFGEIDVRPRRIQRGGIGGPGKGRLGVDLVELEAETQAMKNKLIAFQL